MKSRNGGRFRRAALLLVLTLACSELPALDGATSSRTPTPTKPQPTTPTECDARGGQWIPDARIPAGGACQIDGSPGSWQSTTARPVWAPDAGVDARDASAHDGGG